MDILIVTPELSPYARVSRTGDTVLALSKALCQLDHRVTVAVPRHPGFESAGLLVARRLTPLELGDRGQVTVLDGQLPTGAKLVLFDGPALPPRTSVAGDVGEPSPDAVGAAAAALSRAAVALVRQRAERSEPFDVVHLHDFPTAATAALLRESGPPIASVLTIHDAALRGVIAEDRLESFGLGPSSAGLCREGEGVSLLALGARAADAVTCVSPAVATDLRDPIRFGALGRALHEGNTEVLGILSGLDYASVNPATDSALKSRFDAEDVSNKGVSKTDLLRKSSLDIDPARPLVVAIIEGSTDSGAEVFEASIPTILRSDVSLVILVRGNEGALAQFEDMRREFQDRMAVVDSSGDEPLVRRACAAADIVLLPAVYESTGTLSRIAQRYGALPVARAVGAHLDTVVDCDAELETGTGILFDDATPDALAGAVARGLAAYASPRWPALRRRVMRLDLSWDRPARRYVQVYKQAIASRAKTVNP
jgi:starch synthase